MRRVDGTTRNARATPWARWRRSIRAWTASILAILLPAAALAAPETFDILVMIIDFADVPAPADLRYKDGGT